jgi:hypothetical protein
MNKIKSILNLRKNKNRVINKRKGVQPTTILNEI